MNILRTLNGKRHHDTHRRAVQKMRDTQVFPGYDDDANSVRAEAQYRKVPIDPIPHLQDPQNIVDNLKKKRKPRLT